VCCVDQTVMRKHSINRIQDTVVTYQLRSPVKDSDSVPSLLYSIAFLYLSEPHKATWLTTGDSSPTPARRQTIVFCRHSNTGRRSHTKFFLVMEHSLRQHLGPEQSDIRQLLSGPMVSLGGHLRHFFLGSGYGAV